MQYWTEVAPSPLIFPYKPSNAPNLETIEEEGSDQKMDFVNKRVFNFLLPVFISLASYLLINRCNVII